MNGRPATAASVTYALREAYPRTREDARPALVLFIDLPPNAVDVNVHPAKREVRFRHPADVRDAIITTIRATFAPAAAPAVPAAPADSFVIPFSTPLQPSLPVMPVAAPVSPAAPLPEVPFPPQPSEEGAAVVPPPSEPPARLWKWFHVLAQTSTGYVLLETDAGLVLLDPRAARERISFERLLDHATLVSQPLLIPETVQLPPADSARIRAFKAELEAVGFVLEEFGRDIWKIDALPDFVCGTPTGDILAAVAKDIAELGAKRGSARWRDELIARGVARSFAGASATLTLEGAQQLVAELAATKMPYVCPRGKPVMLFRSHREISRNFGR